jgi:hypothetical protein
MEPGEYEEWYANTTGESSAAIDTERGDK